MATEVAPAATSTLTSELQGGIRRRKSLHREPSATWLVLRGETMLYLEGTPAFGQHKLCQDQALIRLFKDAQLIFL